MSMSRPHRPGPADRYLGKPCGWCADAVDDRAELTLVMVHPASGWEVLHTGCVDERAEVTMSLLLGGR